MLSTVAVQIEHDHLGRRSGKSFSRKSVESPVRKRIHVIIICDRSDRLTGTGQQNPVANDRAVYYRDTGEIHKRERNRGWRHSF